MRVSVAALLKQPVGSRAEFHLAEGSPLDPRGDNAGLRDAGVSSIDADVRATHTNPGAYLEGDVRATLAQECARCLTPLTSRVEAHFAEQYYATVHLETGQPMPAPPPDAKTIASDFRIDLAPLLCEEVILATPQAPLCRPDCKGLCAVCGLDLREAPHDHEQAADERWEKLRALPDLRDRE